MTEPDKPKLELEALEGPGSDSPVSEAIAQLQNDLQAEKDGRLEDRFIGFVVFLVLFDILLLKDAENMFLPVVVLILELIICLLLAKRMGSEEIARLIDRLLHSVSRTKPEE